MVRQKIPTEMLSFNDYDDQTRVQAVKRALGWCNVLAEGTAWEATVEDGVHALVRTINGQHLAVLPLEAARMDLGESTSFSQGHLPVYINGEDACVRARNGNVKPLHTDMVASLLVLLGDDEHMPVEAIPVTLHALLTDEQRANLPVAVPRQRYEPGRPSTTGRVFLSQQQVLNMMESASGAAFEVQFEKRDGSLRNMTARCEPVFHHDENRSESAEGGRSLAYDPSTYLLMPVIEVSTNAHRLVAYDRVTSISWGGQLHRSASYEQDGVVQPP
jgi:hypothetical protein